MGTLTSIFFVLLAVAIMLGIITAFRKERSRKALGALSSKMYGGNAKIVTGVVIGILVAGGAFAYFFLLGDSAKRPVAGAAVKPPPSLSLNDRIRRDGGATIPLGKNFTGFLNVPIGYMVTYLPAQQGKHRIVVRVKRQDGDYATCEHPPSMGKLTGAGDFTRIQFRAPDLRKGQTISFLIALHNAGMQGVYREIAAQPKALCSDD